MLSSPRLVGPVLFVADVLEMAGAGDKEAFSGGGDGMEMPLTCPVLLWH